MSADQLTPVYQAVDALIDYAQTKLGLVAADADYVRNQIFGLFGLASYQPTGTVAGEASIDDVITQFSHAGQEAELFEDYEADQIADRVMGFLSLAPSLLQERFANIRQSHDGSAAMNWLYGYCVDNYYVRRSALQRNPRFEVGDLIITINRSKPEFRTAAKAKAGNAVAGGYPKCAICHENEGFVGRAKSTLRAVPIKVDGQDWFWQYSPYGYFDQHGIAVNNEHTPMHVDKPTFARLMDFSDSFPEFFIGSNAALPNIGGSVLGHDHYQGGRGPLPMQIAKAWKTFTLDAYPGAVIEILDWYNTAIRVVSKKRADIEEISWIITDAWMHYRNEELGLIPSSEKGQHSSVSPTVVRTERGYEMSIIFRSNIATDEFPEGVFHAHPEFWAIKQEAIGLIEAQGLFVLPGRLVPQLAEIEYLLTEGKELTEELAEFKLVFAELLERLDGSRYPKAIKTAIREELGSVCSRILGNTAVFKDKALTEDFLETLGFRALI